jgi:hypothetical protein
LVFNVNFKKDIHQNKPLNKSSNECLFFGKILHIGEKNKTLANPTKRFLGFVFFKSPYFEEKKVKCHHI